MDENHAIAGLIILFVIYLLKVAVYNRPTEVKVTSKKRKVPYYRNGKLVKYLEM